MEVRHIQISNINNYPVKKITGQKYAVNISPEHKLSKDVFIKQQLPANNTPFQGRFHSDSWITKFLKNRSYENSIKGSKRPYLSLSEELTSIIKSVEIKVGKDEKINAFEINPNNANNCLLYTSPSPRD